MEEDASETKKYKEYMYQNKERKKIMDWLVIVLLVVLFLFFIVITKGEILNLLDIFD